LTFENIFKNKTSKGRPSKPVEDPMPPKFYSTKPNETLSEDISQSFEKITSHKFYSTKPNKTSSENDFQSFERPNFIKTRSHARKKHIHLQQGRSPPKTLMILTKAKLIYIMRKPFH
jgi:hypothetical protein